MRRISRHILLTTLTALTLAMLAACGTADGGSGSGKDENNQTISDNQKTTESATEDEGGNTQIANPWIEITEADAPNYCANVFKLPAGATDVTWRANDTLSPNMVEAIFTYDDSTYRARAQQTENGEEDISGTYGGNPNGDEVPLGSWNLTAHQTLRMGEDSSPDENILIWYDPDTKTNYSLVASGLGASKIDIGKVADQMK